MTKPLSLSVIIPAYNEEDIILSSVGQTLDAVKQMGVEYEVIIVNDGSADSTYQLICNNAQPWENTRCVNRERNGGFGAAVNSGIAAATKEFIICVPVDSPMDAETLAAFMKAAPHTDVVASYRVKRVGYTLRMRINSWVYHQMISAIFGMNLKDYNWIHLYRRSIFDKVAFTSKGIFMLAEVLIEANKYRFRIAEIPVEQKQRITGVAASAKLSSILFVLREMLGYYTNTGNDIR